VRGRVVVRGPQLKFPVDRIRQPGKAQALKTPSASAADVAGPAVPSSRAAPSTVSSEGEGGSAALSIVRVCRELSEMPLPVVIIIILVSMTMQGASGARMLRHAGGVARRDVFSTLEDGCVPLAQGARHQLRARDLGFDRFLPVEGRIER
jgi:hypothetical protein